MVNYLAVLVAGVFNMVLGYVWYGPLFGKMWMKDSGMSKSSMNGKGAGPKYVMMYIVSVVLAYFMAWMVQMRGLTSVSDGAMAGAMVWLGFVATTQFGGWLWSGKKFGAYLVDTGYYLVSLVVFGVLFVMWK